ncbi:hypothetical protein AGMMS49983_15230 [Clostridia bacterium]|nr:hypothetical protein AGMMS49983_15230 [Clostridia bacterium]
MIDSGGYVHGVKGRHEDPQPQKKVRATIIECLSDVLSDRSDREIFAAKSTRVYQPIIDQVVMGLMWAA